MTKYDDASWHYDGDYPEDLANENAATHIGIFLAWCINNDLMSEEQIEDSEQEILAVKNRTMTGAEFLINCCDESFTSDDLTEIGATFVNAYYEDKSKFVKRYASFSDDYIDYFNQKAEKEGFEYETIYHIENTFENYDLIVPIINQRFEEWKAFEKSNL
jgi:hypothetical protein